MGSTLFDRCLFSGNSTEGDGGAVMTDASTLTFTECTIAANVCDRRGGGIFSFDTPLLLERTICLDNCALGSAEEIYAYNATLRCSDVDLSGSRPSSLLLEDVIDLDPLFCDPVPCGLSTDGDWSLREGSPCFPEQSPCGELIGAFGGCPFPGGTTGACCFLDGSCQVLTEPECANSTARTSETIPTATRTLVRRLRWNR